MDFSTSLDNYKIFYEVAICKNITKASEKLYISQPAVSQVIKKMEEDLNVILFIRSKKGMELTRVGQKIFERVEMSLKNLHSIEAIINEENGLLCGNLILGSGSNVGRRVLCEPICEFTKKYPNVNIEVVENVQSVMIEKLKKGEIDFVITQENKEINFDFISLFTTKYCFVKSKNMQVDKFITITKGSYSHTLFENFIKDTGLEKSTIEVSGYKMAIELVGRGIGITLVPEYLVQDRIGKDLEMVYTDYVLPSITFGVYYNKALITPASKKFLEYLM